MRTTALFLLFAMALTCACAGESPNTNGIDPLKERATVAERNLVKVRDAVVAYYKDEGKPPRSMNDLDRYGATELESSEDYSELSYGFIGDLKFGDDGKLTQGWFLATPMADTGALQVRMNGVTGKFDFKSQGEEFEPAEEDMPADE